MAARGERQAAATVLRGRDHELGIIRALIDAARAGDGGLLAVEGEPGAGKSALLEAAAASVGDDFTILRTRGLESEAELAFSGLTELLAPLADLGDTLPADQRRTLSAALDGHGSAATGQLPLATAVLALLTSAATRSPLLAVVDDAHWLDGSSLAALGFVARRLSGLPIAILLARRGPEPRLGPPGAAELRLSGLDPDAARDLLADVGVQARKRAPDLRALRIGGRRLRLAADEFDRLLAETRGNPLALIEMARLAASGALDLATLAGGREPLPSGVQVAGLYHDQVVTLPERTRRALVTVAASFTGEAAPIEAALAAADLSVGDLAPAEQAGHVELGAGQIHFGHPLLRSAVYHGASDEDVRDAHRRLADAFADAAGPADREQHAWHRSYAAEALDADAARELAQVAAAAARRGALTAARQAYQRAAMIAPEPAPYLIEAAVCARVEGDADEAVALLDAAAEVLAALEAAGLTKADGKREPRDTSAVHEAAPAEAATATEAAPAETAAAAHEAAQTEPAAAPRPRTAMAPTLRARIEAERARVELSQSDPARLMADLIATAQATADRAHAVNLTIAAAAAGILGAHYREAGVIAAHVLAEAREPTARAAASALSGHLSLLLGDPETARDRTEAAIAALDPADPDAPIEAVVFAAWTRTLLRDWSPGTRALLDEAIRAAHDAGALSRVPPLLAVAADLDQRAGRWDLAHTRALACADLGAGLGQPLWPGLGLTVAARIAAYRGDRPGFEDVRRRLDALPPPADDHPVRLAFRHAEAVLLLDENRAQALRILEDVKHDLENLGVKNPDLIPLRADLDEALDNPVASTEEPEQDPFLKARQAIRQAAALRERRHHAEARALLEPAQETFRRLQAHRWAAKCDEELAKLSGGATPERAGQGKDRGLTQYETQVARRVGAGATNNETAAALFISPKTVEYHLRNLYKKLGIRSRTELARIVATWDDEDPAGP